MIAPQTRGYRASKRNPCPVCNGVRRCKVLPNDAVWCGRSSEEAPPGYRRGKELENGQGFLYLPVDEIDERGRERRKTYTPPQGFGKVLQIGIVGRNAAYRRLVAELDLSDKHRAYLDGRGVPAELAYALGWRSVDPSQPLTNDYPDDLAGIVRRGGRQHLNGAAGILTPVRDPLDRILGFQIRKDNTDSGRYVWLSSKSNRYPERPSPQLPSGELPISCYPGTADRLWLVEGTGPKPLIVSLQTGQTVIGAAGGHFPEAILGEYLQALRPAVVAIAPDAGCLENKHVARQTMATIRQAQALGYRVEVAWWGQTSKTDSLDADDLMLAGRSGEIRFIDSAEYAALHSPELLAKIAPSTPKGLFKVSGRVTPLDLATLKPTSTYSPAGRLDAWERTNTRYVIDVSPTGSGKTTDAGKLTPADFECDQLLYLTNDPRNPSTDTLKDWAYLDGRHAGLALDESANLRRALDGTPAEDLDESANCARTAVADAIRRKRVETESICSSCEHRFNCRGGTGLYNYLHSRVKALKAPRLRAHPQAIRPTDLDGKAVALIFEEAEALASTETVAVTSNERAKLRQRLLANRPNLYSKLAPLLDGLDELAGLATGYGFDTRNTLDHLKPFAVELTPEEADALSGGRVESLDPDLGRYVSDAYVAEEVDTSLRLNWIPDLLDILKGLPGSLQVLSSGTLQITLAPRHIRSLTKHPSVKKVIFLTATADRTLLDALDLDSEQTTICSANNTAKPPKRVQILGFGGLTPKAKRSEKIALAIDLTIDQLRERHGGNIAVIDFKQHLGKHADKAGAWFRDSRGSNAMATVEALVIVGSPVLHIGQMAANYAALTGRVTDSTTAIRPYPVAQIDGETWMHGVEEFKDLELARYLQQKITAEILQAEGRIRANRRQDEALTVYYLTDRPTGLEVASVERARDLISIEIGRDASQRALDEANAQAREWSRSAMVEAIQQHGPDLSCRKLASIAGVSKSLAGEYLKAFREADISENSTVHAEPLNIENDRRGHPELDSPTQVFTPIDHEDQSVLTTTPTETANHWTRPSWWAGSDPIADMCARAAAAIQAQKVMPGEVGRRGAA